MDIIEEGFKRCSKCGQVKPIGDFYKCKMASDGLQRYCKQCNKELRKEYYQNHRENELKNNAEWRSNNKEKWKASNAEWRSNNKEKLKAYQSEWRSKNPNYYEDYIDPQKNPIHWAMKMVRAYRWMDRERGFDDSKTITAEWFVQNIMYKPCAHCGLLQVGAIGANRLNNNIGHEASNLEPCCRNCNSRLGAIYQIERGLAWFQKWKKQSFKEFVNEHKAKDKNLTQI